MSDRGKMLSPDVPEFVPMALRAQEPLETSKPEPKVEATTTIPNLPEQNSVSSSTKEISEDIVTQSNGTEIEVESSIKETNEKPLSSLYSESSLSATSAEFVPSAEFHGGVIYGYNSPADSPGPRQPFGPVSRDSRNNNYGYPDHRQGFYNQAPPMHYYGEQQQWSTEMDYNYYPVVNGGAPYVGGNGEYFVSDGSYIYDPVDSFGNVMMNHNYAFDGQSTPMFRDQSGAGHRGSRGGNRGRGGNRSRGGRRNNDQGNNRGRQVTSQISICGQTGEVTCSSKRQPIDNGNENQKTSPKTPTVHAATILNNSNNWPDLGCDKPKEVSTKSESNQTLPLVVQDPPQALSFSFAAKKNSTEVNNKPAKVTKTSNKEISKKISDKSLKCEIHTDTLQLKDVASLVKETANKRSEKPTESPVDTKISENGESTPIATNGTSTLSKSAKKRAKRKKNTVSNSISDTQDTAPKTDAKPIETKPIETKPIETKPIETKPIEAKPIETKLRQSKVDSSIKLDEPLVAKPIEKSNPKKKVDTSFKTSKPSKSVPIENRSPKKEPSSENVSVSPKKEPSVELEWTTVVRGKSKKVKDNQLEEHMEKNGNSRRNSNPDRKFSKDDSDSSNFNGKTVGSKNLSDEKNHKAVENDDSQPKVNDLNDSKVKEIIEQRALRKERKKQEKKIERETKSLQKQADSRKDSKISVVSSSTKVKKGAAEHFQTSYVMNEEDYPSLSSLPSATSNRRESSSNSSKTVETNNVSSSKNSLAKLQGASGVISSAKSDTSLEVGKTVNNQAKIATPSKGTKAVAHKATESLKGSPLSYSALVASSKAVVTPTVKQEVADEKNANGVLKGAKVNVKKLPLSKLKKVKTTDKLMLDLTSFMQVRPTKTPKYSALPLSLRYEKKSTKRLASKTPKVLTTFVGRRQETTKKKRLSVVGRYKAQKKQRVQDLICLIQDVKKRCESTEPVRDGIGSSNLCSTVSELDESADRASPLAISDDQRYTIIDSIRGDLAFVNSITTHKELMYRNMNSAEVNNLLQTILGELNRYQDRVYHNEPIKLNSKRRFVAGIRETTKKLSKVSLLVLASDFKRSIPVLNEQLNTLLNSAEANNIPVVFGLSRSRISYILHKKKQMKVSCVGVLNYQGVEDKVKELLDLYSELKEKRILKLNASSGSSVSAVQPSSSACEGAETTDRIIGILKSAAGKVQTVSS